MGGSRVVGKSDERGWYAEFRYTDQCGEAVTIVIAEHLRSERQATKLSVAASKLLEVSYIMGYTNGARREREMMAEIAKSNAA